MTLQTPYQTPYKGPKPQAAQFITGRHFDAGKNAPKNSLTAPFNPHPDFGVFWPDGLNCRAFAALSGVTGARR